VNRLTYIGLFIAAVLIVAAVFASFIATHDIYADDTAQRFLPIFTNGHILGTDDIGRDLFSRIVYGARISLQVGITVTFISALIGMFIGAIAGFYGGWVDRILSGYLFNVFLAFPGLLLAIAMVAFLGPGLEKLIFALCVIGWVGYARVMRGQVLKVREYDFVQAARA
jgi:peptide/nickel transport system permease protein